MNSLMKLEDRQDIFAIYIRVSTERQAEFGDSIEMQQNLGEKIIRDSNGVLYKVYIEPAVSATKTKLKDRTVLLQCLRDAELGLFNRLIVYRRDRLARKTEDSLAIRNMLQEAKCDLTFSATGEMQAMLNDPYGKLMENIRSSLDEIESAQISMRVKDTMKDKAKRGEDSGGVLPYGYQRIDRKGKVVIIPDELNVIREIEELYLSGFGMFSIAKWLNGEKITNLGSREMGAAKKVAQHKRSSEKWTKDVITTILFNPFYTGIMQYSTEGQRKMNKGTAPIIRAMGSHEAIRTEERQNQIYNIRDSKSKNVKSPRYYNTSFLLTGLLYCGECGRKYISRNSSRANGKQYSYYTCSSRTTHIGQAPCNSNNFKKELIESFILNQLKTHLSKFDLDEFTRTIQEELKTSKSSSMDSIIELEKKIEKLAKTFKVFNRLLVELDEEDENYEMMKKEYQSEQVNTLKELNIGKEILARVKEELKDKDVEEYSYSEIINKIKDFSNVIDNAPFYLQKVLIDDIVDSIFINPNGELTFRFKIDLPTSDNAKSDKIEVAFDSVAVINFGGVGDTTPPNIITFKMDLESEYIYNFYEWGTDIYNTAKSTYVEWLRVMSGTEQLSIGQLNKLTGLNESTCKEYLNKNTFPLKANAKLISKSLNVDFASFLDFAKIDLHEDVFFDLMQQVIFWKLEPTEVMA